MYMSKLNIYSIIFIKNDLLIIVDASVFFH